MEITEVPYNVFFYLEKCCLSPRKMATPWAQSDWLQAHVIDQIKIKNQRPTVLQTAFRNGQTTRKSTTPNIVWNIFQYLFCTFNMLVCLCYLNMLFCKYFSLRWRRLVHCWLQSNNEMQKVFRSRGDPFCRHR